MQRKLMQFAAETSAGPLDLDLTRVGDSVLVRIEATGDTWNSAYTPGPLAAFLVEFAGVPDTEAAAISEQALGEWEADPGSRAPRSRRQVPKAAAAAGPALVLMALTVLTFGVIAYVVIRSLLGATA
jgi:hypothetical protein